MTEKKRSARHHGMERKSGRDARFFPTFPILLLSVSKYVYSILGPFQRPFEVKQIATYATGMY